MPLKMSLADLAAEAIKKGVPEVNSNELAAIQKNNPQILIIDVREPEERSRGHIPGSVHLPRGILERDVQKTLFSGNVTHADIDRPIVCYCGGGHRSLLAAQSLHQMGFTDVSSLNGGFAAWHRGGHPVESD